MSDKTVISILFTGDFVPVNLNIAQLENCFENVLYVLEGSDLHVTNLEAPLTFSSHPIVKSGPHIKSDPDSVQLLKAAKVDMACLANNHIYDFGERGVLDTIENCEKLGIRTVGIRNANGLTNTFRIECCKGITIGFINFCEHEFRVRPVDELGANGFDSIDAWYQVSGLRPLVDFLVVIYHGGNEYNNLPSPDMKRTFRYLVDIGADAVVCHHTHVFSGYEFYCGKPLVYGLGNFFFPYPDEPDSWHNGIACRMVFSTSISIEMVPIVQCKNGLKVEVAQGERKLLIEREIEALNEIISNDSLLEDEWHRYADDRRLGMLKSMPCLNKFQRFLLKLGVSETFLFPRKRMIQFENIIQCRAHFNLLNSAVRTRR